MAFISALLTLVAPYECIGCTAEGRLWCAVCQGMQAPALPRCYRCQGRYIGFDTCTACAAISNLASVAALYRYERDAKQLVWKLKFGRAAGAAEDIAAALVRQAPIDTTGRLLIAHAPTATSRVRQRGYDQAALIARSLSRQTGIPYRHLLQRSGQQKQVGASRLARSKQLREAFRCPRPHEVRGAHVMLIDDVVTTGATLEAAADVLTRAGALRVDGLVFAQA